MHNNPNLSWKSISESVNIRKGECLQVVHQEAMWKVNLYNKPNEEFKSDYVRKLPYSIKW